MVKRTAHRAATARQTAQCVNGRKVVFGSRPEGIRSRAGKALACQLVQRSRPVIFVALSSGEVSEWSNVPDSKSGVRSNAPGVRIPPSPPDMKPPTGRLHALRMAASWLARPSITYEVEGRSPSASCPKPPPLGLARHRAIPPSPPDMKPPTGRPHALRMAASWLARPSITYEAEGRSPSASCPKPPPSGAASRATPPPRKGRRDRSRRSGRTMSVRGAS